MDEQVDLTTYPEGYMAVMASLDFLPDDPKVRGGYIMGFILTALNG